MIEIGDQCSDHIFDNCTVQNIMHLFIFNFTNKMHFAGLENDEYLKKIKRFRF